MQLFKKTKKLRNGPISLHTKFEPNPCMHMHATVIFVCMYIKMSTKNPQKSKSPLQELEGGHVVPQTSSI